MSMLGFFLNGKNPCPIQALFAAIIPNKLPSFSVPVTIHQDQSHEPCCPMPTIVYLHPHAIILLGHAQLWTLHKSQTNEKKTKKKLLRSDEDQPHIGLIFLFLFFCFGTHEKLDHLASLPSSREMISQPSIKPPTTPFGLSTFPLSSGSSGSSHTIRLVLYHIHLKNFQTTSWIPL